MEEKKKKKTLKSITKFIKIAPSIHLQNLGDNYSNKVKKPKSKCELVGYWL